MTQNKVLESTRILIENPKYVSIDKGKIQETAEKFSKEKLKIPDWKTPVYFEGYDEDVIDFFMLGNSINFAYTDFKTGFKFSTIYRGEKYEGASAMFACLKRAIEQDIPIFDGSCLKNMPRHVMENIFQGNMEIPLFKERWKIFREVGQILCDKYDGYFHNLVEQANGRLFNNGQGLVELLTSNFPSFDDSVIYQGKRVRFDKRAQLAPGMLYGRFLSEGKKLFEDVEELTAFADYVLPKALRGLGILQYEEGLAKKVNTQLIIPAESQEELEIRASTIHSFEMLKNKINEIRSKYDGKGINTLHLDYKLWSEGRNQPGAHHLTPTIAY